MFSIDDFKKYNTEEPIKNIFIINNFLTDLELKLITEYIDTLSQNDWEKEYYESVKLFCLEKFGTDDVEELIKQKKFEITQNWNDKNVSLYTTESMKQVAGNLTLRMFELLTNYPEYVPKGPGAIQRQYTGVPLTAHFDQYTDQSISHAAIIYINDDYTDGELYFPNKDFKIKPKPKSLVIFPGTEEYMHGVYAPGEGPTRYVLPGFIGKKDFYANK
jgi:hypothetical protein